MTQEEKAKAYDEAVIKAKALYGQPLVDNTLLETIFPELKESEDERTRKEILDCFRGMKQQGCFPSKHKEQYDSWIAWLEKQHIDPYNGVCFDCYGHHWGMAARDNGIEITMDRTPVRHFSCKDCEQTFEGKTVPEAINEVKIDNQNCVKPTDKVEPQFKVDDWVVDNHGEVNQVTSVTDDGYGFTLYDGTYVSGCWKDYYHLWSIQDAKDGDVLASEDKDKVFLYNGKLDLRGRVCAYCGIYKTYDGLRFTECAIGNYFTYKESHPATREQRNLLFKKMKEAGYTFDFEKKELNKIEQKPTDKIEPKFKVGDWVVFNNKHQSIYQVEKIENGYYILRHTHGGTFRVCVLHDESLRLWTIKDAKDGDVLATSAGAFIYNGNNGGGSCPGSYCGINTLGRFQTGAEHHWTGKKVYPATKSQYDTLFSKMKEAGYEWSEETHELKKIEQEDEEYNGEDYGIDSLYHAISILEKTLGKVQGYQSDDGILSHKCAITAVKELYKKKPAGWSEEDEENFRDIIGALHSVAYQTSEDEEVRIDWIKSLKQRIGG